MFCHTDVTNRRLNPPPIPIETKGVSAVIDANNKCARTGDGLRGNRMFSAFTKILILGILSAATGVALAQSAAPAPAPAPAADESLTWHGITLYGILDVGIQNQTHGAPISDYFVGGSAEVVQKNSNRSVTGVTPSNMANS